MNNVALSLYSLPLYPSMSPGSPGFSRFLLSPGRASVASNIVKPGEYTYNNLYPMVCYHIVLANGQASTLKTNTKNKKKLTKKKIIQSKHTEIIHRNAEMLLSKHVTNGTYPSSPLLFLHLQQTYL